MARAVFFLFLIVTVVAINALPKCNQNEIYNRCGTQCEPSCDKPKPGVCTLACKIGCECAEGYFRNAGGSCVLTQEC